MMKATLLKIRTANINALLPPRMKTYARTVSTARRQSALFGESLASSLSPRGPRTLTRCRIRERGRAGGAAPRGRSRPHVQDEHRAAREFRVREPRARERAPVERGGLDVGVFVGGPAREDCEDAARAEVYARAREDGAADVVEVLPRVRV